MKSKLALELMVVSLMAGCGAQPQDQQPPSQDEQVLYMNDTYGNLNKSLEAEIKRHQVQVKQLKNRIQVTIADEILFSGAKGGWRARDRRAQQGFPVLAGSQWKTGRGSGFY
jgi:hypothetical protein